MIKLTDCEKCSVYLNEQNILSIIATGGLRSQITLFNETWIVEESPSQVIELIRKEQKK